eukprot:CAMPEP_0174298874 /NCGR_PEP_ID=MMETSP0809-20121228/55068_1 /TAXON_ID=73025 ORGANISM="Eutreptiella gymnastica-like, Strain CCMP1594" /NCGR_SAMPLE_ID=MMETSP0809 /ASSEMBLY_ACC=CAM_ASM_000658 /LENGTH=114 /DNA_ID=CAMNT_0015403649 /DNA_START=94 /DNA_END=438 /DNA_ORIENTATION=+
MTRAASCGQEPDGQEHAHRYIFPMHQCCALGAWGYATLAIGVKLSIPMGRGVSLAASPLPSKNDPKHRQTHGCAPNDRQGIGKRNTRPHLGRMRGLPIPLYDLGYLWYMAERQY